jgi:ElaB/YqjD/DUF883 family membrane-anchored ribosome-binding protein
MADKLSNLAKDAYAKGKTKAEAAVSSGKSTAKKAVKATRSGANRAKTATADSVDRNPMTAIIGGLAIGAIAAMLLPSTKRENKIAGKFGKSVRAKSGEAARSARSTAMETLDNLGVNADAARDQIRGLASKLGEVASSAGKSAAETVRNTKK